MGVLLRCESILIILFCLGLSLEYYVSSNLSLNLKISLIMPGMNYMYDQPSIYLAMYRIDIWLYVVCGVVYGHVFFVAHFGTA